MPTVDRDVGRIRQRVERFLAEDHPERLSELRELQRRVVGDRHHRKLMKSSAGIGAVIDNAIPGMHVRRMRRGAPKPLERLRYQCWELGYQTGVEVDEHRDFQFVLYRWARRPGDRELGEDLPEPDQLTEVVVHRLLPSRFWKLVLGFVPIVGPIAAYRLDVALALRFHDLATEYFRDLKSAGIRRLPDDFAIPRPPRADRVRKKGGSSDSMRRTVERFLAEHRSDEHLYHVRGMARIGTSARTARRIAGAPGLATNLIPIRHLKFGFRDIEAHMFLMMLQAICFQAALNAGREHEHGDDFERVLLLWAGGRQGDEAPAPDRLIAAVSAKLHAACLWKLAFGFLPLIGGIMGLMIDGSMAARIYRLAHRYYEQREPLAPIAR
jgi:hypothetical protein